MQQEAAVTRKFNPSEDLEALAQERGVPLSKACKRAGIAFSTVCRWKNKPPKSFENYNQLVDAIIAISSEK